MGENPHLRKVDVGFLKKVIDNRQRFAYTNQ